MKEFQEQLNVFSEPNTFSISEKYFERYWLNERDLTTRWHSVMRKVFNLERKYPEMLFNSDFELIPMNGGILLTRTEFESLRRCLIVTQDREFAIIEHNDPSHPFTSILRNSGEVPHPSLRFVFPKDISWDELNNGGLVTMEMLQMPHKNYYVVGDSALWGKYSANDYDHPTDILGFRPEVSQTFTEQFGHELETLSTVEHLPVEYALRIPLR